MIQVQQLKLPVGHKDTALLEALIAKLHVKKDDILSFEVAKAPSMPERNRSFLQLCG